MDMVVEHSLLPEGVGEKHSGQQISSSNHSPPQQSLALHFVRATKGSSVGEKYLSPIRSPEVHLILDRSSSVQGYTFSFTPTSTSWGFHRHIIQDAGYSPSDPLPWLLWIRVLLSKNRAYLLQNCNICRVYVLFWNLNVSKTPDSSIPLQKPGTMFLSDYTHTQ